MILANDAKIYASTAEAVADCEHVYTTVRKRGHVTKPVRTRRRRAVDSPKPAVMRCYSGARHHQRAVPKTSRWRGIL
jgi:hypothetical protein